jgi:environmental stress-induced protein Ves
MNADDECATMRSVVLAAIAPQAWRNDGGRTRELLCWPSPEDWALRISVADIEADGPFSNFPDVERWFAVIEGAGVTLAFGDTEHRVVRGDPPLRFDGAHGPGCHLIDGPTRDLNLMARRGKGVMRQAEPGVAWNEPVAMRGLYAAVAGRWSCDNDYADVPAHALLWTDAAEATIWTFEPDQASSSIAGWWLGYTPEGVQR